MSKYNIILNETTLTKITDMIAVQASKNGATPLVVAVGCADYDNSELMRLYEAAVKIKETFANDNHMEAPMLAECVLEAIKKACKRRNLTI